MLFGNFTPRSSGLPPTAGQTTGEVLVVGPSGSAEWGSVAGTGDVVGPVSSVAGNIPVFADTSGKVLIDSGFAPSDFSSGPSGVDNIVLNHEFYLDGQTVLNDTKVFTYETQSESTLKSVIVRPSSPRLSGTLTVLIKKNGVTQATLVLDNVNDDKIENSGLNVNYLVDDLLEIHITDSAFTPVPNTITVSILLD